jgi:signal peptidase II
MKTFWKFFAVVFGVILLDQLSKSYLLALLTGGVPLYGNAFEILPYPFWVHKVSSIFNIVFTWNPGTSFSLFRALGESAPIVIVIITGFIIGFLGHRLMFGGIKNYEKWALSLIVGGALGNLIDRIRFRAVIDFLDFHAFGWHWPAFNIADIMISIGVGLYLLNWVMGEKRATNHESRTTRK